jgi:tetratricopeptide (TPR) repeat protein
VAENTRIAELRKRLEKEPGSRLFAQLAEELRKDGELEEAIRVARTGLEGHPTYTSARMTLGRALLDTGDLAHARAEFETVLRTAPENILAGRYLGECLEGLGDLGAALLQYRSTLRLVPGGDRAIEARIRGVEERLGSAARPAAAPPSAPSPPAPPPPERPGPGAATSVFPAPMAPAAPPAPTEPPRREPLRAAPPPRAAAPPMAEPPGAELADTNFEVAFDAENDTLRPEESDAARTQARAGAGTLPGRLYAATEEPDTLPGTGAGGTEMASVTLAELYFNQGLVGRAVELYRQLVQREPGNQRNQARLVELQGIERHLREGEPGGEDRRAARRRALERTIARLEDLLAAVKGHHWA